MDCRISYSRLDPKDLNLFRVTHHCPSEGEEGLPFHDCVDLSADRFPQSISQLHTVHPVQYGFQLSTMTHDIIIV